MDTSKFKTAIQREIESCKTTGYDADDHFRGVTKMVTLGSCSERPVEDFMQPVNKNNLCSSVFICGSKGM